MLSEYTQIVFPGGVRTAMPEQMGGNSLALVLLVGAGGIVLGVLSLLGINAAILSPIAVIGFGTALLLSSNAVWRLYVLRRNSALMDTSVAQSQHVGAEMLASEMASGSAGIQALAGLAAIVLGILALAGSPAELTLNLIALLRSAPRSCSPAARSALRF